jgi:hypothetical protein
MKKTIILLLLLNFATNRASAYDSDMVHPAINEYASKESPNLISALKNIGLENNVNGVLKGEKVFRWFRKGGTLEDFPISRADNHFHDPLQPWSNAGLKDSLIGTSSIIWAQNQSSNPPINGGDRSWKRARLFYFNALVSASKSEREQNLADAFVSLGQVMHLLADSSVPAHVRNDIHVFPLNVPLTHIEIGGQTYESWAAKSLDKLNFVGLSVSPTIFSQAVNSSLAPVPISALWDMDKYIGTNIDIAAGVDIGLAEYTNANFFSEDTIFADYPHPAYTDTTYPNIDWAHPEVTDAEDGKLDSRIYIRRTVGDADARLASLSYISYDCIKKGHYDFSPIVLDDTVYNDYAALLIPRAVGYSAGLLDYFFRGSIEISLPLSGIYSSTNDANAGFTRITLLAEDKTSNGDEMSSGTIELVVKYKAAVETSEFYYKVIPEANGINSIPRAQAVELIFDLSQDPLPVTATDVYLQLVYHGKLGNEDDAVAVGFKDISEPTPIDVFNNMDKICINHGMTTNWYDAGSQAAIQQVDENGDGIAYGTNEWDIYPHNLTLYVKFYNSIVEPEYASPSSYDYLIENIPAGTPMRAVYVLGDERLDYSYYPVRNATDSHDYWDHVDFLSLYHGDTARNQEGDHPVLYTFRNFRMWPGAGFIYVNAPYPDNSAQCPLSSL